MYTCIPRAQGFRLSSFKGYSHRLFRLLFEGLSSLKGYSHSQRVLRGYSIANKIEVTKALKLDA
jgi:hypothetical protein